MDPSYADRPLHISVRMNDNVAVRNTLVQNSWQTEERQGRFPFCQGQGFLMTILVKSHCYTVSYYWIIEKKTEHFLPLEFAKSLKIQNAR